MAGVGPFAIPAARKGVFVHANDLNPHCADGLRKSVELNDVGTFVRVSMKDGHDFIREATKELLEGEPWIAHLPTKKPSRRKGKSGGSPPRDGSPRGLGLDTQQGKKMRAPRTFSHYIMNLPETAIKFLPSFQGIYNGYEKLFRPHTATPLPLVHCYCFGHKVDPEEGWSREKIEEEIMGRVREAFRNEIGANLRVAKRSEEEQEKELEEGECEIRDVRDVAPNKQEICCTIRLSREIIFAKV